MSSNDKILRAALLSHPLDTLDRLSRASERAKRQIASRHAIIDWAFLTYTAILSLRRLAVSSLSMHGTVQGKFRCHGAASLYSGSMRMFHFCFPCPVSCSFGFLLSFWVIWFMRFFYFISGIIVCYSLQIGRAHV